MRKPSLEGCMRVCQTAMLAAFCIGSVHAQSDYAVNRPQKNAEPLSVANAPGRLAGSFAPITGRIIAPDGTPMADATVTVKGTSKFTVSKADGSFSIMANAGDVLIISSIGYSTVQIRVTDEKELTVNMTDDKKEMNEVVVTALGIKKQARSVGYSTTQLAGSKVSEARTQNIGDALTGQIAGVSVGGVSTGPYGTSRVLIRGNSSIGANNMPLYVIDNVPYDNSNQGSSGQWGGADYGDGLSNINPDDIESIQVLKGVAASALYGYRGGNGAILITTKSGSKSKGVGVELNNNLTFTRFIDQRDYQYQYGQGSQGVKPVDVTTANNTAEQSWGPKIDGSQAINSFGNAYAYKAQKDNWNHFFTTGLTNQSSVALLGSNDKGHFRLGISDLYLGSNIPNSTMQQQGFNFNTNYNLTSKLSFTLTANYMFEGVKNRASFSDAPGNVIAPLLYLPSTFDVRWLKPRVDSDRNELLPSAPDIYFENPYFVAHEFLNTTSRNRLTGGLTLRYAILSWLYVQAAVTRDGYTFDVRQVVPNGVKYQDANGGQITLSSLNQHELNGNAMIGINKNFGEKFTLNASGGANSQDNVNFGSNSTAGPFIVPYFYSINNTNNRPYTYDYGHSHVNSIYGNLDLGYRNFLFLNFTARKDWFSQLNPNTNSYFYPSVSGSFVFSDAFKMPAAISFGKLRASYGASSNSGAANPYANVLPYGFQGYTSNGQAVGDITTNVIPNSKLKPVAIREYEVGANVEFLDNRIGFDAAVYSKKTTADIVQVSVAQTSGYSYNLINVGQMQNRGFELLLNGTPLKGKDFIWNISLNFAYNKNKVLSVGDGTDYTLDVPRNGTASIRAVKGLPYGQIVGYHYKRDAKNNIIFDATGIPERTDDLLPFGSGQYDKTGGLSNDFHYKNFTFSFLIDYKFGAKIYSQTNMALEGDGLSKKTLAGREVGNYTGKGYVGKGVTEDGKVNDVAVNTQTYFSLVAGGANNVDEEFIYDASFIKLRNVIISYGLPKSILGKNGFFKGVNISLVARNLAVLMKHTPNIDPESNYSAGNAQGLELSGYPAVRSLGFNLNVKF